MFSIGRGDTVHRFLKYRGPRRLKQQNKTRGQVLPFAFAAMYKPNLARRKSAVPLSFTLR